MSTYVGKFLIRDYFSDGRPGPCYQITDTREEAEVILQSYGENTNIVVIREECPTCGAPIDPSERRGLVPNCADCR